MNLKKDNLQREIECDNSHINHLGTECVGILGKENTAERIRDGL